MSNDLIQPIETKTPFQKFKESVKNTEPKPVSKGTVIERGLAYFSEAGRGEVWESNTDDLDRYQLMLNEKGIRSIHRAYKFSVTPGGAIPSPVLTMNVIATRQAWPSENVRLKVGDEVNLYTWKQGEYVQFGFRKE
jgi:hypothetical protein